MTDLIQLPKRALSVRQPWAWAIAFGGKDIENRSVAAVRHGMKPERIALHASKGMTRGEYEDAAAFMAQIGIDCPAPHLLVRGGIIALMTVAEIVERSDSLWFFGPCGLVLTDVVALNAPIPVVGALGYFEWAQSGELEKPKRWMRPGRTTEVINPGFDLEGL